MIRETADGIAIAVGALRRGNIMMHTAIIESSAAAVLTTQPSDHMMRGWWGLGILWWLLWLAVLVLVLVLIWRLTRGVTAPPSDSTHETPAEILKRRYARGEIDREEYEQMMRDLGY